MADERGPRDDGGREPGRDGGGDRGRSQGDGQRGRLGSGRDQRGSGGRGDPGVRGGPPSGRFDRPRPGYDRPAEGQGGGSRGGSGAPRSGFGFRGQDRYDDRPRHGGREYPPSGANRPGPRPWDDDRRGGQGGDRRGGPDPRYDDRPSYRGGQGRPRFEPRRPAGGDDRGYGQRGAGPAGRGFDPGRGRQPFDGPRDRGFDRGPDRGFDRRPDSGFDRAPDRGFDRGPGRPGVRPSEGGPGQRSYQARPRPAQGGYQGGQFAGRPVYGDRPPRGGFDGPRTAPQQRHEPRDAAPRPWEDEPGAKLGADAAETGGFDAGWEPSGPPDEPQTFADAARLAEPFQRRPHAARPPVGRAAGAGHVVGRAGRPGRPGDRPGFVARRPPGPSIEGLSLAEGEELVAGRRPVEEAFVARREARRLLVVPQRRMALEKLVLHATNLRIPVVEVEGGSLTAIAGFDGHQGIALVVAPRRWAAPDDILALAKQRDQAPLVLVLDSLEDPQNVGTLLRTAEASGVHGAIFPTHRQAPLTPAAVKASAGAVEHLQLAPVDDLAAALADLHVRGLRIVGADGDAQLTAREADLRGPVAIVVGSEGQGLGPAIRRRCDLLVRIPMHGRIESLNAAVAGSILLYEAAAQRGLHGDRPGSSAATLGTADADPDEPPESTPAGSGTAEVATPAPTASTEDAERKSESRADAGEAAPAPADPPESTADATPSEAEDAAASTAKPRRARATAKGAAPTKRAPAEPSGQGAADSTAKPAADATAKLAAKRTRRAAPSKPDATPAPDDLDLLPGGPPIEAGGTPAEAADIAGEPPGETAPEV